MEIKLELRYSKPFSQRRRTNREYALSKGVVVQKGEAYYLRDDGVIEDRDGNIRYIPQNVADSISSIYELMPKFGFLTKTDDSEPLCGNCHKVISVDPATGKLPEFCPECGKRIVERPKNSYVYAGPNNTNSEFSEKDYVVELKEIPEEEAPVVMIVHDFVGFGVCSWAPEELRGHEGTLYKMVRMNELVCCTQPEDVGKAMLPVPVDMIVHGLERNARDYWKERDRIVENVQNYASKYALIGGVVYEEVNEPRYVINTFGLGHNHGHPGTCLGVTYYYNSNLSYKAYFNALQHKEAIEEAIQVATRRGDDLSIPYIQKNSTKEYIEVLDESYVKCDPKKWGCKGDEFHQQLEAITESADSAMEAGLLTIMSIGK